MDGEPHHYYRSGEASPEAATWIKDGTSIGRGRYGGTYLSTWYVYLEVSDEYYHLATVFILKYGSEIVTNQYDCSLQYLLCTVIWYFVIYYYHVQLYFCGDSSVRCQHSRRVPNDNMMPRPLPSRSQRQWWCLLWVIMDIGDGMALMAWTDLGYFKHYSKH